MAQFRNNRIKYFIPDWDDRYDPFFNFGEDDFSPQHKANIKNDVYAHELLAAPPYDGILYSLGNLFASINSTDNLENVTIKGRSTVQDYFNLQNAKTELKCFGDCGAFNYINLDEPPEKFTPENIAFLYNKLGFDYGVSVDHLVVETIVEKDGKEKKRRILIKKEKQARIKLSLDNAEKFLHTCKNNNYTFMPIGSAQGDSPKSYKKSVEALVEMGYEYIALGGLVRRNTKSILQIVKTISPALKGQKLHLLGVIRPNCIEEFKKLGVSSVDSASFLRKAWLRSGQNYISSDGDTWYTALRVPIVNEVRTRVQKKMFHSDDIEKMEKNCLQTLKAYERREVDVETALEVLLNYDSLFVRNGYDGTGLEENYRRTLYDRPWEQCPCPMCRQLGIDILIFRKTNRNKRRGLHNTWVFYNTLNV
jgi:hypothetical protein